MPVFKPPTHEEPMRTNVRPLNYFRLTYAASVVKVNGSFTSVRSPSAELLDGLAEGVDFFRGGYEYEISLEVAAELEAAGINGASDLLPGYGMGLYGKGPYGA